MKPTTAKACKPSNFIYVLFKNAKIETQQLFSSLKYN